MKGRLCWFLVLPVIVICTSCGTPSTIATSISCTGYMQVENSRYKEKASKKREARVKHKNKSYLKKK
ncbi:MAG: hypothetical protein HC905_23545 [Bacteroidales bacterium]|nr:hypothetical protein [Bacteroidales bacterium]